MSKKRLRDNTIIFLVLFFIAGLFHALDSSPFGFFNTFAFTANFVIYFGLIVLWIRSVYDRLLPSYTRRYMIVEALFMLIYMILRTVKYRIVGSAIAMRLCWYSYYIPIVMIPSFFLISAISFGSNSVPEDLSSPKLAGRVNMFSVIASFSVLLSLGVVTNDIHNLAFIPKVPLEEFSGENGTYSHGPLFYGVYIWVVAAVTIGVAYLIHITRKVSNWKKIIYILIPLVLVPILNAVGDFLESIGRETLYKMPELYVFALIAVLEICLRNRLITYNEDYRGIFSQLNIPVLITSSDYKSIYKTENPIDISQKEMEWALQLPVFIDEDTKLCGMKVRGGNVFWTEDQSEINKMNSSLEEANETLDLENKLIKYENDQKEERARIDARNQVYRKAATSVYKEQKIIERLLSNMNPGDENFRRDVAYVSIYNAYVKRKSNFVLTYSEEERISSRELYLAMDEMIRFTGYLGVLGSVENMSKGSLSYKSTLSLYELFLNLGELVLNDITKLLVVITEDGIRMIMDYPDDIEIEHDDWNISTDREGKSLYVTISEKRGGENG